MITHNFGNDVPCGLGDIDADEVWYRYYNGGYDGRGVILVRKGDGYYLGNLGHCSCYGPLDNFNPVSDWREFDYVRSMQSAGYSDETRELFEAADTKRGPIDTRPVKCVFCDEKMYYINHPRYEDEATLDISAFHTISGRFYAHLRCLPSQLKKA